MKKIGVVFNVAVIAIIVISLYAVLSLLTFVSGSGISEKEKIVADDYQEIYQELQEQGNVRVIVMLKEKQETIKGVQINELKPAEKLSIKKAAIKENQNKVLSSISEKDFKLKYKYSTINALAGNITKAGLERLKINPNVASIELD